ncbi:MAG: DUF1328 domain-containing protein, partial [Thermoguttaceae bacterium]
CPFQAGQKATQARWPYQRADASIQNEPQTTRGGTMLSWALTFLVIALIAAVFGFGGIAAGAAGIAKILFFLFLILFIVSLVAGGFRRPVV